MSISGSIRERVNWQRVKGLVPWGGIGVFGGSYGSRISGEGGMKRSQVLLPLLGK